MNRYYVDQWGDVRERAEPKRSKWYDDRLVCGPWNGADARRIAKALNAMYGWVES